MRIVPVRIVPVRIVFVCTGNTGRSVMAEAVANQIIATRDLPMVVTSRALDLNRNAVMPEEHAVAVLSARGLDVTCHQALALTLGDVDHCDLIFTATAQHKATIIARFQQAGNKVFTLSEYATGTHADVVDAFGQPVEVYARTLVQISGYVPVALDKAVRIFAP